MGEVPCELSPVINRGGVVGTVPLPPVDDTFPARPDTKGLVVALATVL